MTTTTTTPNFNLTVVASPQKPGGQALTNNFTTIDTALGNVNTNLNNLYISLIREALFTNAQLTDKHGTLTNMYIDACQDTTGIDPNFYSSGVFYDTGTHTFYQPQILLDTSSLINGGGNILIKSYIGSAPNATPALESDSNDSTQLRSGFSLSLGGVSKTLTSASYNNSTYVVTYSTGLSNQAGSTAFSFSLTGTSQLVINVGSVSRRTMYLTSFSTTPNLTLNDYVSYNVNYPLICSSTLFFETINAVTPITKMGVYVIGQGPSLYYVSNDGGINYTPVTNGNFVTCVDEYNNTISGTQLKVKVSLMNGSTLSAIGFAGLV